MTDKIFIDTNIIVYDYLQNDFDKHIKAKNFINSLIDKEIFISTQVLSETYSVLKRNDIDNANAKYYIEYCIEKYNILPITLNDIKTCLKIRDSQNYSYWDCLILSTAINNNCVYVYSEDMQHKHIVYAGLQVINPMYKREEQ